MLLITFTVVIVFAVLRIGDIAAIIRSFFSALSPLLIGGCIAFVMNLLLRPLERFWIKLWKKYPAFAQKSARPICLVISSLIVLGLITALLFVIIPEIIDTIVSIIDQLPEYFKRVKAWWDSLGQTLAKHSIVLPELDLANSDLFQKIMEIVSQGGQAVIDKTVGITKGVFSTVFNIVVGFIFSLYILAGKERYGKKLKKLAEALLPKGHIDRIVEEIGRINRTFSNFVAGQLIEAIIIGVLCFVGMLIFRMPYASVVSVLVGVTALVPVFGAFIGTAIGALLILVLNPVKAFWFIVFIIVLQQIEGNVIYPHVAGRAVGLPGILVLVSVTLGGNLFGIVGMLVSVPVCSLAYFTIVEFVGKRLEEKGIDGDEPPFDVDPGDNNVKKGKKIGIKEIFYAFFSNKRHDRKNENKGESPDENSDVGSDDASKE